MCVSRIISLEHSSLHVTSQSHSPMQGPESRFQSRRTMGRLRWFLFFRAWKQYLERYYFLVCLFPCTLLGCSIELIWMVVSELYFDRGNFYDFTSLEVALPLWLADILDCYYKTKSPG
ncbi:hypothetical protein PR202_ga12377 [Eleusine coracana subsp. coracana]|uniref:Uncharacterized protein n=1 Tax=Eleusine coracana subsp. coracana TaxID=191504 RepID=A0AAV5CBX7_ELECO|nr:hypothetical protein PR202_ga12377 [Eleusine coracana subsp. coracana]